MFEDIETHKKLSKWIIGTFTACILIYLGIRHISHVADAVMWLKDLLNPLLIGLILALFLNVPLGVIERHLFPKHPTSRKTKMRRPLAILLSFILVIGVFVGVAFLVKPSSPAPWRNTRPGKSCVCQDLKKVFYGAVR